MSTLKSKIFALFQNKKTGHGITDLGDAMDQAARNRCCGQDCCEDVIYIKDKATSVKRVLYSKNGVTLNVTEATYLADKAAGFV